MTSRPETRYPVLFVCTGNVFRSLAAEQALKARLRSQESYMISSAGIDAKPQEVHAWVRTRLHEKGGDVSHHVPRQLTQEMVNSTEFIVAMGRNHQTFIRERFGREVPLFNEICFGRNEPILDIHEVMPEWQSDLVQAQAYISSVIDIIWESVPSLFPHLPPPR